MVSKGKILIVDDEIEIVSLLKDVLEENGYETLTAYNGAEALPLIVKKPDLILLDVMMPVMDGIEFCRKVRDVLSCPIIFLTSREGEEDKIKGFCVGGDDYVIKPFSLKEILARIEAHLKRQNRINQSEKKLMIYGELMIDLQAKQINFKQKNIILTSKEYEIIELLALNPGQIFSKENIFEKVWGYDSESDLATVTAHVRNIRSKFEDIDKTAEFISTVWGVGYKWQK